jgi:hypothetical protein
VWRRRITVVWRRRCLNAGATFSLIATARCAATCGPERRARSEGLCSLSPRWPRRGALLATRFPASTSQRRPRARACWVGRLRITCSHLTSEHGPGYSLCPTRERPGPLLPENASGRPFGRPSLGLLGSGGFRGFGYAAACAGSPTLMVRSIRCALSNSMRRRSSYAGFSAQVRARGARIFNSSVDKLLGL